MLIVRIFFFLFLFLLFFIYFVFFFLYMSPHYGYQCNNACPGKWIDDALLCWNTCICVCELNRASDNRIMENIIQRNGEMEPNGGPPPVPITKINQTPNNLGSNTMKKDKRMNSSRFNISKNRELTPLPRLAGKYSTTENYIISIIVYGVFCVIVFDMQH